MKRFCDHPYYYGHFGYSDAAGRTEDRARIERSQPDHSSENCAESLDRD